VKVRIVSRQGELAPVLDPQAHIHRANGQHPCLFAVDQAACGVVAGPAHTVAGSQHHRMRLEEVEPVADVAGRVDPALPAVGMREQNALVSCVHHAAGIADPGGDAVDVMVEDRDVARPVVCDVTLLRSRQVQIDVALDLRKRLSPPILPLCVI